VWEEEKRSEERERKRERDALLINRKQSN